MSDTVVIVGSVVLVVGLAVALRFLKLRDEPITLSLPSFGGPAEAATNALSISPETMRVVLSFAVLGLLVWGIVTADAEAKKWGYGAFGTVLGYWFGAKTEERKQKESFDPSGPDLPDAGPRPRS